MSVKVTEDCIGCGTCEGIAPDFFAIEDDGLAHVTGEPAGTEAEIAEAIEACPVSAIVAE